MLILEKIYQFFKFILNFRMYADRMSVPIYAHWHAKPSLIDSSLKISSDVTSNPVSKFLRVDICQLGNYNFVVVEIICEFFSVLLYKFDCSYLDKTRSNISHTIHSSNNFTSIGNSGSSCLMTCNLTLRGGFSIPLDQMCSLTDGSM